MFSAALNYLTWNTSWRNGLDFLYLFMIWYLCESFASRGDYAVWNTSLLQRSHLCHLLYLLTRKEDVKSFRIQMLLKIHKLVSSLTLTFFQRNPLILDWLFNMKFCFWIGHFVFFFKSPQPHVLGLLSVYKLYCPHLVAISVVRSRKVCS